MKMVENLLAGVMHLVGTSSPRARSMVEGSALPLSGPRQEGSPNGISCDYHIVYLTSGLGSSIFFLLQS